MMVTLTNGMARSGCTVYCPQLAGHCGTDEDLRATTWQDWYAVLDNELERLRKEHDQVFVIGLSMGGCLTLRLAEEHGGLALRCFAGADGVQYHQQDGRDDGYQHHVPVANDAPRVLADAHLVGSSGGGVLGHGAEVYR